MRNIYNNNGISLIEVLAVIVIGSIISLLAFTVLTQLLTTEKKVSVNAQLRDEADYYIEKLSNKIYTSNEMNNLCGPIHNSSDPSYSYIYTAKSCGDLSEKKKITGFYREGSVLGLFIDGDKISGSNPNIEVCNSSYMTKTEPNLYTISLTLNYNGKSKTFISEVHSISN